MSLSLEELEQRAFDPPHLGMPGWACQAGRWEDESRFVEIFVAVREDRVIDTGFLTNIPGNGLVCASVYCDQVLEKAVEEARMLEAPDLLVLFPEQMQGDAELEKILEICVQAGKKSLGAYSPES